jgi:beta-glucosidase
MSTAALQATITQKAVRVVYSLAAVGALDGNNTNTSSRNVTSAAHRALARKLASASTTLLRNARRTLPLDVDALKRGAPGSIALLGVAAQGKGAIYGGSGSGAVVPAAPVSIGDALRARLGRSRALVHADGTDVAAAQALAKAATLAIVVIAQTSSEGRDRATLALDQSALVASVAAVQPNTVVVAISPGPFLTPWRDDVAAILDMGFPGEQEGHALADVLFGDVNPAARMPHSMPATANDYAMTPAQYPGTAPKITHAVPACSTTPTASLPSGLNPSGGTGAAPCAPYEAHYSERLLVGYRYYDAKGIAPAFPFGHGCVALSLRRTRRCRCSVPVQRAAHSSAGSRNAHVLTPPPPPCARPSPPPHAASRTRPSRTLTPRRRAAK